MPTKKKSPKKSAELSRSEIARHDIARRDVPTHVHNPADTMDRPQHRPHVEEHGVRAADDQGTGVGKPGRSTPKSAQRSKKKTENEWKIAG